MGKSTPWHCADIPFVFQNIELVPVCAFEGAKRLEAEIFGAVMQFARTGAPGWAPVRRMWNRPCFSAPKAVWCRTTITH